MSTKTKNARTLTIGLAVAAAACLIFAVFTQQWLVNGGRFSEIGIGLHDSYACTSFSRGMSEAECQYTSNAELVDTFRELPRGEKLTSSAFVPAGKATFVILLIAAAGLLAAAGLAAARKPLELPIAPTTIAVLGCMIGLIVGCVFVATKPGPPGMVGVGFSFWLFGIGCTAGIVGAQLLAKLNRPPDPDWADDPIQPASS